jgi:hypothetical protein
MKIMRETDEREREREREERDCVLRRQEVMM